MPANDVLGLELALRSWPDLAQAAPATVLDKARICAFLALGPRQGEVVAKALDLPREQLAGVLRELLENDHLGPAEPGQARALDDIPVEHATQPVQGFLSKLWRKLVPF